jgi:hypothetical protein
MVRVAIQRSVLIALIVLACPKSIVAQTPLPGDDTDPLKLPREILVEALNARTTPLTDVQIPVGTVPWNITFFSLGHGYVIITYALGNTRPFRLQAIFCEETLGGQKSTRFDPTILGPTETAEQFYSSNLTFVMGPTESLPPCMAEGSTYSVKNGWVKRDWETERRDVFLTTSHDRVLRHISNWVRYLAGQGNDPDRAFSFLAVGLRHEAEWLYELSTGTDLQAAVHHLNLLEETVPDSVFEPRPRLSAEEIAQVRRFLSLRLKLREKLAIFAGDSPRLIQRDKDLLNMFNSPQ